jgi:hypothetical protein
MCYKEVQLSPTESYTFWYVRYGSPVLAHGITCILVRVPGNSYSPPCRWVVGGLCLHGLGLWVGMVFWCWRDGICWNSCVYIIGRSVVSFIQSTCLSFLRPQPCAHVPHPTHPTLPFNTPNSIPHPPAHPLHPKWHSDTTRYPLQRAIAQTNWHFYILRIFAISSWHFTSLFSQDSRRGAFLNSPIFSAGPASARSVWTVKEGWLRNRPVRP